MASRSNSRRLANETEAAQNAGPSRSRSLSREAGSNGLRGGGHVACVQVEPRCALAPWSWRSLRVAAARLATATQRPRPAAAPRAAAAHRGRHPDRVSRSRRNRSHRRSRTVHRVARGPGDPGRSKALAVPRPVHSKLAQPRFGGRSRRSNVALELPCSRSRGRSPCRARGRERRLPPQPAPQHRHGRGNSLPPSPHRRCRTRRRPKGRGAGGCGTRAVDCSDPSSIGQTPASTVHAPQRNRDSHVLLAV